MDYGAVRGHLVDGAPKRAIHPLTKACMTASAVIDDRENASGHRVKRSRGNCIPWKEVSYCIVLAMNMSDDRSELCNEIQVVNVGLGERKSMVCGR